MKNRVTCSAIILVILCIQTSFGQGTFTAIANGSWTNSGSWSHTGTDGDNIPDADDIVTIPSLRTISMPTGVQQVASLTIQGNGTLNMNNPGAVLDIFPNGGLLQVDLNGTIANNSTTTEINFLNNSSFIINGNVGADLFEFEGAGQTVTITGSGTLLVERFNVNNIDVTVTLNTTGSFGSNPNPLTVNSSNFTIDGTGTINLGGGGDLNIGSSGVKVGCTMTISDDIAVIANSCSLTILSGGVVNVSNEVRVGPTTNDGDNFTLNVDNGGTLSVGNEFQFNVGGGGGSGADNFTMNNVGTTTVSGDININSVANSVFSNSGTFTLSGDILNAPATNPSTFTNNASSTFNISGDIDNDVSLTFSATGNTVNYASNGGTDIEDPTGNSYYNLTVGGASNRLLRDNITVGGNLTIQNTATLNSNSRDISLAGNWTNTSSNGFVEGTRTVTFNGSTPQTISVNLAAGETFNNLVIDNSSGTSPQIVLSDIVNVATALTMTNGIVQSSATNLLIMLNTASATIGSAASYVDGPIQFNMAVNNNTRSLNFPIGKSGTYGAVALRVRHNSATSYSYTAEVIGSSATALGYTLATGTDKVSGLRYWDIKRGTTAAPLTTSNANLVTTGAGNAPQLTINYVAADEVDQPATLTVVKNIGGGTAWFDIGATASGSPVGSVTTTAPSANFTSFSFFTLANLTGGTNPLPIELLSFDAKVVNDRVMLEWETASELNNDFFTLERAYNIEEFEAFGEPIDGKGTTSERNDYSAFDENPIYGRSYYRLKQTDFDGAFTYSAVRTIDYEGPEFSVLKVYPNPSGGDQITIELIGLKNQPTVPVQIFNVQGQKVFDHVLDVTTPGTLRQNLEFSRPLNPGLYIIKAGQTLQLIQKLVVN